MSHFSFVDNKILQKNLDVVFDHVLELFMVLGKKKNNLVKSGFRKTMIIHMASIIEALLLWKLKKEIKSKKVELSDDWKYCKIEVLYPVSKSRHIIAGEKILKKKKLDRLDFDRIIFSCFKYQIITEAMFTELDKVRKLRNNLHISSMKGVDKQYDVKDLKFVFSVADKVGKIVSKK